MVRLSFTLLLLCGAATAPLRGAIPDEQFSRLAERYLDEFAAFSPVSATALGDHRFDDQLDSVDENARTRRLAWLKEVLHQVEQLPLAEMRRSNQVDWALLRHRLRSQIWSQTELREWAWNPLIYTALLGDSIYNLMARDFAPLPQRMASTVSRLEQFPRFLKQVRQTLVSKRVPAIHAQTASSQNRGVLKIIDKMVRPGAASLSKLEQVRLENAIQLATTAIERHQTWLDEQLMPAAQASYRLPAPLYEKKLAFQLHSSRTRLGIRTAAERRIDQLHQMMLEIAAPINRAAGRKVAASPSPSLRKEVIRFALGKAYAEVPSADALVSTAQRSAAQVRNFIQERKIVSLMPDPLEIMLMPEFRRGVSVAYCDAPGPLDVGQKTFYVVSPIPSDWSAEQTHSFLREYNTRSLHVLTIHEALPGHFLQLAHSNRYQGKLRHLFQSGVFVEGWACYTEWMMCEEGFLGNDPLMKLITLKWYLRDAMNAILDSAVHVDGMTRKEAMRRMMDDAFQEEREAAGKWKRAQLTSAQLSTYFVGYLDQIAMREAAETAWGDRFVLQDYHDRVLSYGSPPPQFVRALLLDQPIPR